MHIFGGLMGIIFGFLIIKYRERVGEMVGDPAWASKVGGIYNVLIIVGILMALWGLTTMTNTSDFLFGPIINMIPHKVKNPPTNF